MKKTRGLLLAAGVSLALAFTFSCSSGDDGNSTLPPGGNGIPGPSVPHGGETYQTVVIGEQTWFARNLNYNAIGSKCYGEDGIVGITGDILSDDEIQANCAKYGRLYDWETALTACPSGWHLPSYAEYNKMTAYIGVAGVGGKLKATSGWGSSGGTDDYGFSALPGGIGAPGGGIGSGGYNMAGSFGGWWSARENEDDSRRAYASVIYSTSVGIFWEDNMDKSSTLLSVRCLQD